MDDQVNGHDQENSGNDAPHERRVIRYFSKAYKQFREYSSRHQQEAPQDKFGRRLAHSTVWIAILTTVIVGVGILQYCSSEGQLRVMRGQLAEMRAASAIQRNALEANMIVKIDRLREPSGWGIKSIWKNAGKTNAQHFRGWDDFKIFHDKEEIDKTKFFIQSYTESGVHYLGGIVIRPNESVTSATKYITMDDAKDIIAKHATAILWGFIEYDDIFNKRYTQRYCYLLMFELSDFRISMSLPAAFHDECNRATQEETKPQ